VPPTSLTSISFASSTSVASRMLFVRAETLSASFFQSHS
jgi:hypothetical protein